MQKLVSHALEWSWAQLEADHFREQSLVFNVALTACCAWVWLGQSVSAGQIHPVGGLGLMGVVLGAGWLVYRLYQTHYVQALCLFIVAQILFIASMSWLTHNPLLNYMFFLPIVIAGGLAGPIGASVTAVVVIGIEAGLAAFITGATGDKVLFGGLIFLHLLTALISGQSAQGVYAALGAAEVSAQEARKHAEEARKNRGELRRKVKSLDLAYAQLQRANVELFRAHEIADEALRFKSEFVAQISHELRTPLNLIIGFSETMAFAQNAYGVKLPRAYLRDVTEIYRNSRHLLALIDDILDLSKLNAGRMGLRYEPVDFGGVMHEALDMIRPLMQAKNLELVLEMPETLPGLWLDRTRIHQVLLNLLSNAARLTQQGQITLRAVLNEAELVIQVSDTGPGISPDALQQVFEEFYQAEGTAGVSGTTGLGLAVSKRIIQLHGGRMWAESQPGHGSTFSFALPIQADTRPVLVAGDSTPSQPQKAHPVVMIVGEASSAEVKLLQRHLGEYSLVVVPTLDKVDPVARKTGARAVIVDALSHERLAEEDKLSIPIIVCPLPSSKQAAQLLDITDYVRKPVMLSTIQAALQKAVPEAGTLLIVDDEPSAVRLLERMALAADPAYQIVRAYSGQEAIVRIRAHPPDVVLLDLGMPEDDGFTVIETLRKDPLTAHIPIIVVSGHSLDDPGNNYPLSIYNRQGFTPTEMLEYLRALLSVIPPAAVEHQPNIPPLSANPIG